MIYLFHGSDVEKARAKAFEWVAKARAKEPNLAYARLAREELTSAALEDAALSGGLFVKRLLILIDDPLPAGRQGSQSEEEETGEENAGNILEEHLDSLVASDNAIIILAPKLPAVKAKKISAKATKTYEFAAPARHTGPSVSGFNTNLVNALAARSREKLWLEVNRALRQGDAPEMLHGLLHWKARAMRDRQLSLDLISLLQSSRRSGLDLSLSLERFALSL